MSSEIGESDAQAAPAPSSKANRKAEENLDLAAEDSPSVAEPSGVPEITFPLLDQVRSLDLIEPYMGFPEALLQLDGKEVQLIGFMAPFDSLENMRRCMIVPTYVGCTFCSPPDLTQVVYVTQGDGDTAGKYPYVDTVAHVRGALRLSVPSNEHEGALQGTSLTAGERRRHGTARRYGGAHCEPRDFAAPVGDHRGRGGARRSGGRGGRGAPRA